MQDQAVTLNLRGISSEKEQTDRMNTEMQPPVNVLLGGVSVGGSTHGVMNAARIPSKWQSLTQKVCGSLRTSALNVCLNISFNIVCKGNYASET